MKRETGYYWVKIRQFNGRVMDWETAYWENLPNRGVWFFAFSDGEFDDSYLSEINEIRIKNPDEK